jgi:hypothetical protein
VKKFQVLRPNALVDLQVLKLWKISKSWGFGLSLSLEAKTRILFGLQGSSGIFKSQYDIVTLVPNGEEFPRGCGHENMTRRHGSEGSVGGTGPSRMKMWSSPGHSAGTASRQKRREEYPHRSQCPPNSLPISLKIRLPCLYKARLFGTIKHLTYLHVPPRAHGLHMGWPCKQTGLETKPESRPASLTLHA